MSARPCTTVSPSTASFTSTAHVAFNRSAKDVVNRAGMFVAFAEAGGGVLGGAPHRVPERAVKLALREMFRRYLFAAPPDGPRPKTARAPKPQRPRARQHTKSKR